jgi:hypothetical protein
MSKQKVTFIIPFATPGSGKSFCWEAIKKHLTGLSNWSFESISSDEIRGELIRQVMQRDNCNRDKAFSQTMKSGPAEYGRQLRGVCERSGSSKNKENHLVFLDKNHPKDAVSKLISEISQFLPKNVHAKFLYLIPRINRKYQVYALPLSTSFMLQVMSRCQSRTEHHTLDNKDPL